MYWLRFRQGFLEGGHFLNPVKLGCRTTKAMIKVFISSVSKGLEDVRNDIINDLRTGRYGVVHMEAFGARPELPLDVCLQELRTADVAVVIIGPRYGSPIPSGEVSYTHEEYREANRRGIPVLAFRLDTATDVDEGDKQRLEQFAREAAASLTYQHVPRLERLSALVQASLTAAAGRGDIGPNVKLFQTWEQFFARQLAAGSTKPTLLNHLSPFVGRTDELKQLIAFVQGRHPVFLLSAPGGTGKSRLLLELAHAIERSTPNPPVVRFIDAGVDWTPADVAALPTVPTILIVDDAHRRPNLDRLLLACNQRNPEVRFVVSCRPGAIDIVRPHLAHLVIEGSANDTLHLGVLPKSAAHELAEACLGPDYKHLADRLTSVADGVPLVIVVGARCVSSQQIVPEMLNRKPDEFRQVVLDSLLGDPGFTTGGGETRKQVLEVLSAIGPVNVESDVLIQRFAAFCRLQMHDLTRFLDELKIFGFIQQRGRLIRVTPDVLADHLLYRAALRTTGQPTGFVDAVLKSFAPELLGNILANAAELDWRSSAASSGELVLTTTWQAILNSLHTLSNWQRRELLGHLRRAALFAPNDVLKILEWLHGHPEAPEDNTRAAFGLDADRVQVSDALSSLSGFIAQHPDYTQRCVRVLWHLALTDERPTNSHPNHPRRQLEELLRYDRHKTPAVQLHTLRFVVDYTRATGRDPMPWVAPLVGNVLARQVESRIAVKRTVTLGAAPLAPHIKRLKIRRKETVDCLSAMGSGRHIAEAMRAIHELGRHLRKPLGMFGRSVTKEEVAAWLPEAREIVQHLEDIATNAPSQVTRYFARRELREVPQEHWPELTPSVRKAVAHTGAIEREGLFDLLIGVPWDERLDDWRDEQARIVTFSTEIAEKLWTECNSPVRLVTLLLDTISSFGESVQVSGQNEWRTERMVSRPRSDQSKT
jgi:hypothetical protein